MYCEDGMDVSPCEAIKGRYSIFDLCLSTFPECPVPWQPEIDGDISLGHQGPEWSLMEIMFSKEQVKVKRLVSQRGSVINN